MRVGPIAVCTLATSATTTARIVGFDIGWDGSLIKFEPVLVELVKVTAAASGGTTFTPLAVGPDTSRTAQATARINDTGDGTSPTVLAAWVRADIGGFSYQWPLGREPNVPVSAFWELRVTPANNEVLANYDVNLWFEE